VAWLHRCSSRMPRGARRRKRRLRKECGSWNQNAVGFVGEIQEWTMAEVGLPGHLWHTGRAQSLGRCHVGRLARCGCGTRAAGGGKQSGGSGNKCNFHLGKIGWFDFEFRRASRASVGARLAAGLIAARQNAHQKSALSRTRPGPSTHALRAPKKRFPSRSAPWFTPLRSAPRELACVASHLIPMQQSHDAPNRPPDNESGIPSHAGNL
jgi:hypothetical protein